MFDLRHIDHVIVLMRAEPLDPYDALFEIDRRDQPVTASLDVEDDALRFDDASRGVTPLHIDGTAPIRFASLVEPRVERSRERCLVLMPDARIDKASKGTPGDDTHFASVSCAHFGRNNIPARRRSGGRAKVP